MVHVLLKPGLENFECYFDSMWDECNCAVVWAFFGNIHGKIKLPISAGSLKKHESSIKTSTSALLTMPKHLNLLITTNCGKLFKRWEYQTTWPVSWEICMQIRTVRTGHGARDWFQIGKGVHQGCILPPCLFNLHAEYIMRNVGLDEEQAGTNFTVRYINNLRYEDDTILWQKVKKN